MFVVSNDHVAELPISWEIIIVTLCVHILPRALFDAIDSDSDFLKSLQLNGGVCFSLLEDFKCHVIIPIDIQLRPIPVWPGINDIRERRCCRKVILLSMDRQDH